MNLKELRDALKLALTSAHARVLLVTSQPAPPPADQRLVILTSVPPSNEPLQFAIIVFVAPFRKSEADSLERWLRLAQRKTPIIRIDEPVGEIIRIIAVRLSLAGTPPERQSEVAPPRMESARKRPGQHGWRDQFIIENISPGWTSYREESVLLNKLAAAVGHPLTADSFTHRIADLEKLGKIPGRIGKLSSFQLAELILELVDVDRVVDYREEQRLTEAINQRVATQRRKTTFGSVHNAFLRLRRRGLILPIPSERKLFPQDVWVPQHIKPMRISDWAEAERLWVQASQCGYTWTRKSIRKTIRQLLREGAIPGALES
ncbi:MAG: hypothetical protein Q7R62_00740 [bacterium]|nr:hypothetical protein [bacterium]